MTEKKWKTAEEFLAEMQNDEDFQRKQVAISRRLESRRLVLAKLVDPILDDLRANGFEATSLPDLVEKHGPLNREIVDILLRWLKLASSGDLSDMSDQARVAESIVRALGASKVSFNGEALISCFDHTNNEGLKWAIANTIALTHPSSIGDWVSQKLESQYWGKTLRDLGFKK